MFMHLTNYAINKHSENFVRDDEEAGSKRCVPCVRTCVLFNIHFVHICMYVYKICIYIYIYIYICTYMYVCMYVLACMYVCAAYRRITTVNSWLLEQGVDVAKVWQDIEVPCVCTCAVMYVRAYVHT